MAVYINGLFSKIDDSVAGIWSDTQRFEYDPKERSRYVLTIVKVDNFEEAEGLIDKVLTHISYHDGYSTPEDIKRIINALVYTSRK